MREKIITAVVAALVTALVFWLLDRYRSEAFIPPGVVVAFDGDNCPSGWDNFGAAEGLFIVGAGTDEFKPGTRGGSATTTLTIANLPPHGHNLSKYEKKFSPSNATHTVAFAGGPSNPDDPVAMQGEGKPFSTLPPWIAMTLCEKK